ncbi:MAG: hypothetical protein JSW28_01155 [Thermoplasmata archaeon]|nr:MAG: hypothetical protein JSW28_01155 [Thermoplasmata archaeon]
MKRNMRVALAVITCCACVMAVLAYKGYDMGTLNRLFGKPESASGKK